MRHDDPRHHSTHWVYVVWRDDTPVYVGMTSNPDQRLTTWGLFTPRKSPPSWWGPVTHVDVWNVGPGRTNAERVERDTIQALDPAQNRQWSPRVERDKQAWHEYCEWADALRLADAFPDREWAVDQELADRLCAAVGREAPDVAAFVEANRAHLRRVVESLPDLATPEAAVA